MHQQSTSRSSTIQKSDEVNKGHFLLDELSIQQNGLVCRIYKLIEAHGKNMVHINVVWCHETSR